MANKTLNTRIQHKTDTSANWAQAENFSPLKGELIIYQEENENNSKIKVGDGNTNVNDLPFVESPAIIDVVELPTENINEEVFYRLLSGSLIFNQATQNAYTCYCVKTLPESGKPATNIDQTAGNVYYNVSDGQLYGYVDTMLSYGLNVPVGWYTADVLLGALGFQYKGVITDITEDPIDNSFRFLLKYIVYSYKDEKWTSLESIGWRGTGMSSEIFNYPSNIASGVMSHAEGYNTTASGDYSHAEGYYTTASGYYSHAEGCETTASGNYSHAEGSDTTASSVMSHAEGANTTASGYYSHAEGSDTTASAYSSHAEGYNTTASGDDSHAEGSSTTASGNRSHAEGEYTTASGDYSHAEGGHTTASGNYSHAEGDGDWQIYRLTGEANAVEYVSSGSNFSYLIVGAPVKYYTYIDNISTCIAATVTAIDSDNLKITLNRTLSADTALQKASVQICVSGMALGDYSHSEGNETIAVGQSQHVQGKYNIADTASEYAHIVGNGSSCTERSNAHTLDWDGNAEFQGDVKANACGGEEPISLIETYNLAMNASNAVVQPDWNQNDSTQPDYIQNRTHYTEQLYEPIYWDGNTEGLENFDLSALYGYDPGTIIFYKISDQILTEEQITSSSIVTTVDNRVGQDSDFEIDNSSGVVAFSYSTFAPESTDLTDLVDLAGGVFSVIDETALQIMMSYGLNVTSTGLYCCQNYNAPHELKLYAEIVHKMEEKYLPELSKVAKTGDYNDLANRPTIKSDVVLYSYQELTKMEKDQARGNIGAASLQGTFSTNDIYSLLYDNILRTDKFNKEEFNQNLHDKLITPLITSIEGYAFRNNSYIKYVVLPSLNDIDDETFAYCLRLELVDLKAINKIYGQPFKGCTKLVTLIIRNKNKVCEVNVPHFLYSTPIENGTGYIYVPKLLVEDYKVAQGWSNYASQIRAIEDYPDICAETKQIIATEEYVDEKITQSDWNQSDETASDFIKNKPFGETTSTQQVAVTESDIDWGNSIWDEVNGYSYVKLTDIAPQKEAIVGTEFTFLDGMVWEYNTYTFTSAEDVVEGKMYRLHNEVEYMGNTDWEVYVVLEDDVYYLGTTWSKGVWSRTDDSMGTIVCEIRFSSEAIIINKLEEKYLPNTVAKKSEIPSVPTKVSELENDANYKVIATKRTLHYGETYDMWELFEEYNSGNVEFFISESNNFDGNNYEAPAITLISDSADIVMYADIKGYRYKLTYGGWSKESISNDGFYRSKRDFEHGTLITTNIDYSVDGGAAWLLELKGNSYVDQIPFDIHLQGYIYKDENNTEGMINYGGFSNGRFFDDINAFCYNGQLCFWFPRLGYWQGFDVRVSNELSETENSPNCVVSITDEVKPTNITKEISFKGLIVESINVNNIQYQAAYSATHDSNNNNIVETYATKEELANIGGGSGSSSPAFIDYDAQEFNTDDFYTSKIRKQLDGGSYIYASLSKVKIIDEYDSKLFVFTAFDLERNCICQITMDDSSINWGYTEKSLATTEVVEQQLLGGTW